MGEILGFILAFAILLCFSGWAIDKYKQLEMLKANYEDKVMQCEVTYEAMLSLIREFSKKELKIYREKYSEILSDLYEAPADNEELIKIYELLVEEIELRLSSFDDDGRSSGGITVEA